MDVARTAIRVGYDRFGLALALAERARWVQHRLDAGIALGVTQHEETLTQSLLLDLRMAVPELDVRVFTRAEESRKFGADWAWWWQGDGRWFGHLVQAKRLLSLPRGERGYALGYRPARRAGDGSDPPLQIETLLAAADNQQVPAIYALYNDSVQFPLAGPCPYIKQGDPAEGITLLSAEVADALLRRDSRPDGSVPAHLMLSSVGPRARPWSCLALCEMATCQPWLYSSPLLWRDLGFPQEPRTTDLAFGAALRVFLAERANRPFEFSLQDRGVDVERSRVPLGVRESAPSWVRELASASDTSFGDAALDAADAPAEVNGLVVIRPTNVGQA